MIDFAGIYFHVLSGHESGGFFGVGEWKGGHKTDTEPSLSVHGHTLGAIAILYILRNHGSTNGRRSTVKHQHYGLSFAATSHLQRDKFL